jgi:hypothetical protein
LLEIVEAERRGEPLERYARGVVLERWRQADEARSSR